MIPGGIDGEHGLADFRHQSRIDAGAARGFAEKMSCLHIIAPVKGSCRQV